MMHPQYLIRKGGYYYRPKAEGYTANPEGAGLFTREQAIRYSHPNGPNGPRDGITYIHRSVAMPQPSFWPRLFGGKV